MNRQLIAPHRPNLESVLLPDGITPQEAHYALNVFQGFTHFEAYRHAYAEKARKMSDAQISRAAYKTKIKPVVQKYIKALSAELERSAVATALLTGLPT